MAVCSTNSFKAFCSVLCISAASFASSTYAQIYRCDNNGVVDYNNNVASAKSKNCTVASLPTITTIPAPAAPAAPSATASPSKAATAPTAKATPSPSPSSFPKVDSGTQKARDNDRAAILDEERKKENMKLQELKKEYNAGEPERKGDERNYQKYLDRVEKLKEDIQRSENNLKSLDRELQGSKG
jgi:hypothetical protein